MISRRQMPVGVCFRIAVLWFCTGTCAWAQTAGTLTLAGGKVVLLRETSVYAAAEGAKLQAGDILRTDAKGQAQVEFQSGSRFNLGAATEVLLLNVSRGRGDTEIVVLTGWVKFALKKSGMGALRFHTPGPQVLAEDAVAVLRAGSSAVELFVETGTAKLAETGKRGAAGSLRTIKGGEFIARTGEQPAVIAGRPPAPFIAAMPRHFLDDLPVLLDRFKDRKAEPKREHETSYAEVGAWLKAGPAYSKTFVKRFEARARDAEFRKGLVDNLREHPEWDPVLYPEKYLPKPNKNPSSSSP